jgi:amino acid transporter
VAEAAVEERQLLKALRWYDGFVVALANPGFLIAALGYAIGSLGGWGAMLLWGFSAVMATMQNWIYAECAGMFPDKSGGISLYAHEGWRRYFSLIGPIATFGYWFAWSSVLAIFGVTVGFLIQAEWFPGQDWAVDIGIITVDFPKTVGASLVILVWGFNIFGVRPAVWFGYVTGALLLIPLAVFMILPYFTGDWQSANMDWGGLDFSGGGIRLALVWLYLMGWSAYGVETCAVFAPEYHDTVRDTTRALKSSAVFSLAVYALLPVGITGVVGTDAAVADPVAFYVPAFEQILGGAGGGVMVFLLIASLVLSMNTATMDGSRALYGIAKDDMTVKQLARLNRYFVPGRAMTVDVIVNLVLMFSLSSTLSILAAGNLGYILAHVFALSGFILLRKDRPGWPRPIKLAAVWVPVAGILAALNGLFIAIGSWSFELTGYGGLRQLLIGIGVLLFSVLLFLYRRVVQDKQPITFREEPEAMPAMSAGAPVVSGGP